MANEKYISAVRVRVRLKLDNSTSKTSKVMIDKDLERISPKYAMTQKDAGQAGRIRRLA